MMALVIFLRAEATFSLSPPERIQSRAPQMKKTRVPMPPTIKRREMAFFRIMPMRLPLAGAGTPTL